MAETKETAPTPKTNEPTEVPLPPSPPPRHPSSQPLAVPGANSPEPQAGGSGSSSRFKRALSKHNRHIAWRFFSAYAQAWVGMSPVWLMGEALMPGKKVGTQFNKGRRSLVEAAEEVRQIVTTSGKDVIVIVDEKLRSSGEGGRQIAERTAEVIKAAGENVILVVTTSLEKLSKQLSESGKGKGKDSEKPSLSSINFRELAHDPELKRSLQRHGRDALVLLDGALKHPVVITGVSKFALSRGIPYADALLRLASLGLGKILRALPEDVQKEVSERVEAKIEEIDAEELERRSTSEEREEAESLGNISGKAPTPKVEGEAPEENDDPYATMRKRNECLVM